MQEKHPDTRQLPTNDKGQRVDPFTGEVLVPVDELREAAERIITTVKVDYPPLPVEKSHWLTAKEVCRGIHVAPKADTVEKIRSILQNWVEKEEVEFEPTNSKDPNQQKILKSRDLVGYYQNIKAKTIYCNPIALPLVEKELGLSPIQPTENQNWLHSTQLQRDFHTTNLKNEVDRINRCLEDMFKDKNKKYVLPGRSEDEPAQECLSTDVIHKYRSLCDGVDRIFIDPRLVPLVMRQLGILPMLPDDRSHWLTGQNLCKAIGTAHNPDTAIKLNTILEKMAEDKEAKYPVKVGGKNVDLRTDEVIAKYRNRGGKITAWYVDPRIIFEIEKRMGLPPKIPDERRHWNCGQILCQNSFKMKASPEKVGAMNSLLQKTLDANNEYNLRGKTVRADEVIGKYRTFGKVGGLYLDPDAVGIVITREMINAEAEQMAESLGNTVQKTSPATKIGDADEPKLPGHVREQLDQKRKNQREK